MGIRAGSSKDSLQPALATCGAHGLHYDPSTSSGCVLCRKSLRPAAERSAARALLPWLLLGVGLCSIAIAAAAWVVRRSRAPEVPLSAEQVAHTTLSAATPSPTSTGASASSDSDPVPPAAIVSGTGVGPAIPAPLSPQTFGVAPEFIPMFHEAELSERMTLVAPLDELPEVTRARLEAERTNCGNGSLDACLLQLRDCAAISPTGAGERRFDTPAMQVQRVMLERALSGPNGMALRQALANGGAGLPPDLAAAAQALGVGHERERAAARAQLWNQCQDGPARAALPAACEGGSLPACERLIEQPNHAALLPHACEVGVRNACLELSRALGMTTPAGEAARLRTLQLDRCSRPGSCTARSRDELLGTALNTLRAGMNRVCVQRGPVECKQLAEEFEREHSDPTLLVELRSYNCDLGDIGSCAELSRMYGEGRGVARDERQALALNERVEADRRKALKEIEACDAGGCELLKLVAQTKQPFLAAEEQRVRAQLAPDLATQKCDAGDLSTCMALINALSVGSRSDPTRLTAARRRAVTLLEAPCNAGKADSCRVLAEVLFELDPADRARGSAILDRSCSAGSFSDCLRFGSKTNDPALKASAMSRALPIAEAECNAGQAAACSYAELEYRVLDPKKSAEFAAKGRKLVMQGTH